MVNCESLDKNGLIRINLCVICLETESVPPLVSPQVRAPEVRGTFLVVLLFASEVRRARTS